MELLVKIIIVLFCIIGLGISFFFIRMKANFFYEKKTFKVLFFSISGILLVRVLALVGFIVLPVTTTVAANYHTFEGVKKVGYCNSCHIMEPMVNDMVDPESLSLAARHYKMGSLGQKEQCYTCHSGYGLGGTLKAKMDGYRHLFRYVTHTYELPIKIKGTFNNQNCLDCHSQGKNFTAVPDHQAFFSVTDNKLFSSQVSCLECHGLAHPKRSTRSSEVSFKGQETSHYK